MTTLTTEPLVLTEFVERTFSREELSDDLGMQLWETYGSSPQRISVEFPSPKTDNKWVLKNLGYVGLIPLGRDHTLSLQPKVPVTNVFRMLEYAYRLDIFRKGDDLVGARSMRELYESLARVLSRRVRDRGRKGLYRTYIGREERLSVVRGRLDMRDLQRLHADPRLLCRFEEHTPDNEDNQILLDALDRVLRSGLCSAEAQAEVREAHRVLRAAASPATFGERNLLGRSYTRLNHDYRGLHALARFFVAHTGPTHRSGAAGMAPFLIDMAELFERFVAAWLHEHLPPGLYTRAQETGSYDPEGDIGYRIDLVLYDAAGVPLAVLDTKYKRDTMSSSNDVAQVVCYASRKGCRHAFLVYPSALEEPKAFSVGGISVSAAGFPLDRDFGAAGTSLLRRMTFLGGGANT